MFDDNEKVIDWKKQKTGRLVRYTGGKSWVVMWHDGELYNVTNKMQKEKFEGEKRYELIE